MLQQLNFKVHAHLQTFYSLFALILYALYVGLFLFSQERLVILKFQDFRGVVVVIVVLVILGFFGLTFFSTVTTVNSRFLL